MHTHTDVHMYYINACIHMHARKFKCIYLLNIQHRVNPDGSILVEITLNKVVTEVMTAAKTLKQLNVDIPDQALQILKQVCLCINTFTIYRMVAKDLKEHWLNSYPVA